ncbi:MAG: copper resistance protein B [Rhodanobacter sp.]
MSGRRRHRAIVIRRRTLLAALSLALPLFASAQTAPASSGSTAPTDRGDMADMDHTAMHHAARPAHAGTTATPAEEAQVKQRTHTAHASTTAGAKSEMDHGTPMTVQHHADHDVSHGDHQAAPNVPHDAPADDEAWPEMNMGPMQGGKAPANARSSDYSDGTAASPAHQLHLHGSAPSSMLLIEQLEAVHRREGNGQSWEAQAWYGSDSDKLWLRSEGELSRGTLEDGDLEVFWNHNISTFWSRQLGARQDFGEGPARSWTAFGVQGLAPYWFEVEATGYVGASGRTAMRLRADYEMLFTQRLILQPEAEVNLYGRNDAQRRLGSGVSDIQFGLRLRYEIRRELAPYLGVNWVRRVGTSADYARQDQRPVLDRQIVAGFRIWF